MDPFATMSSLMPSVMTTYLPENKKCITNSGIALIKTLLVNAKDLTFLKWLKKRTLEWDYLRLSNILKEVKKMDLWLKMNSNRCWESFLPRFPTMTPLLPSFKLTGTLSRMMMLVLRMVTSCTYLNWWDRDWLLYQMVLKKNTKLETCSELLTRIKAVLLP